MYHYEMVEQRPIVYIDESGFALDSPRERGYSPIGSRCYDQKDWQAKGRVNAIGAIVNFKFINICLFPCNINADIFHQWVIQELIPSTPQGAVVVMDNATFHRRKDTIQAIEENNLILEMMPTYSPDLNPIEKKWAQAKAMRKKHGYTPNEIFKYGNL